jgi:formylmethanofuran dehydrogenase subunit C
MINTLQLIAQNTTTMRIYLGSLLTEQQASNLGIIARLQSIMTTDSAILTKLGQVITVQGEVTVDGDVSVTGDVGVRNELGTVLVVQPIP